MKTKYLWKLMTIAIVSVMCTAFVACGDDDDDIANETPFFNVSPIHLLAKESVPYNGVFTINTNQQWEITEKPSWVSLDVTEGKGKQEVTATITTSDKDYRTGNIVVSTLDKQFEKTVEISQNGNTLSVVTGDYKGSEVKKGAFMGTDKKQYTYEHKVKVEFSVNGSYLASNYGVSNSTIQGTLSDGVHSTTLLIYSNNASTSVTYRAFATDKATGQKVYGIEKTIISSSN